jgi:hypothetical protein
VIPAIVPIAGAFLFGMFVEGVVRHYSCRACQWNPNAPYLPKWQPRICAYRIGNREGQSTAACTHLAIPGEKMCRQHWQEAHGVKAAG